MSEGVAGGLQRLAELGHPVPGVKAGAVQPGLIGPVQQAQVQQLVPAGPLDLPGLAVQQLRGHVVAAQLVEEVQQLLEEGRLPGGAAVDLQQRRHLHQGLLQGQQLAAGVQRHLGGAAGEGQHPVAQAAEAEDLRMAAGGVPAEAAQVHLRLVGGVLRHQQDLPAGSPSSGSGGAPVPIFPFWPGPSGSSAWRDLLCAISKIIVAYPADPCYPVLEDFPRRTAHAHSPRPHRRPGPESPLTRPWPRPSGRQPATTSTRWLYVPNHYSEYRYILGTRGQRPLICVGINPSTAAPDALDPTLQSAQRIALANGYDSFLMFNVYAQRATRPDDMEPSCNPALHAENRKAFRYLLSLSRAPGGVGRLGQHHREAGVSHGLPAGLRRRRRGRRSQVVHRRPPAEVRPSPPPPVPAGRTPSWWISTSRRI